MMKQHTEEKLIFKEKSELRKSMLEKRRRIPAELQSKAATQIAARLKATREWQETEKIGIYVSVDGEVSTRELIEDAWKAGKRVFVPKVEGDDLVFHELTAWEELAPGFKGIPEPRGNRSEGEAGKEPCGRGSEGEAGKEPCGRGPEGEAGKEPCGNSTDAEGALMILPGVAFDRRGNRMGYGRGFYDRYLAAHPWMKTIALSYEFAVMNSIPVSEQDRCVDMIITERDVISLEMTPFPATGE